MDQITIKVSDLCHLAEQLKQDDMQYVRLMLLEADDDIPASIAVTAVKSASSESSIDYDGIDLAEDVEI